jgi:hypothetical protein
VPDNGGGTVTLPPAGCDYLSPQGFHEIVNGLPPGTTIQVEAVHKDILCGRDPAANPICTFMPPIPGVDCSDPGGSLGGEKECSDSTLELHLQGTGMLAGYSRVLDLPVAFETHTAPRTPGNPVQSFDTDMFRLGGQLPPGDPDFDLLRIRAGTGFGMPSPGHTTLIRQPGGTWAVDSFFDVFYEIEFHGAPGGPFAGMGGSTTGTIRMETSNPCVHTPVDCNDNNACTIDSCDPQTGQCIYASILCDDGNPCTTNGCDAATGCVYGPMTVPGEVSVRHQPDKSTIVWVAEPVSSTYDVVRGTVALLPVGPGLGDEFCLPTNVPFVNDPPHPPVGFGRFYVVRGKNQTCPGSYGRGHTNPGPPLNGPMRTTTTCP